MLTQDLPRDRHRYLRWRAAFVAEGQDGARAYAYDHNLRLPKLAALYQREAAIRHRVKIDATVHAYVGAGVATAAASASLPDSLPADSAAVLQQVLAQSFAPTVSCYSGVPQLGYLAQPLCAGVHGFKTKYAILHPEASVWAASSDGGGSPQLVVFSRLNGVGGHAMMASATPLPHNSDQLESWFKPAGTLERLKEACARGFTSQTVTGVAPALFSALFSAPLSELEFEHKYHCAVERDTPRCVL